MNIYFFIAGLLCILLGLVHSFLGEFLIFKFKRHCGILVPSKGSADLKERHLRIIWATWHLASVFGWGIGLVILKISFDQDVMNTDIADFIIQTIVYTMVGSSLLVFVGTKGKHPGWVVLLSISVLLLIGS